MIGGYTYLIFFVNQKIKRHRFPKGDSRGCSLPAQGALSCPLQQTIAVTIRRYGVCLTTCLCILPSPSLTGWTAFSLGVYQSRCSIPRNPCRFLLSCGVRLAVKCIDEKKPLSQTPVEKHHLFRMTLPHSGSESDITVFSFASVSTPS